MTPPDTDLADKLTALMGGTDLLGLVAVLKFAKGILDSSERSHKKGWMALAAGLGIIAWSVFLLIWAWPTIWRSWRYDGDLQPSLVGLTATATVLIAIAALVVWRSRSMVHYLADSYRADDDGNLPRLLRWLARHW